MNLVVNYTLTLQNLEDALRALKKAKATYPKLDPTKKQSPEFSIQRFVGWLVILTFAIVVFLIYRKDPAPVAGSPPHLEDGPLLTWGPYVLIFIVIIPLVWLRLSPRAQAKRAWQKNPDFQQPQTLMATPEMLRMKSPTADTSFTWEHFTHFYECKSIFLLFNASKTANIIPKHAFSTPEDAVTFADYCRSHISRVPSAFPVIINAPSTAA